MAARVHGSRGAAALPGEARHGVGATERQGPTQHVAVLAGLHGLPLLLLRAQLLLVCTTPCTSKVFRKTKHFVLVSISCFGWMYTHEQGMKREDRPIGCTHQ